MTATRGRGGCSQAKGGVSRSVLGLSAWREEGEGDGEGDGTYVRVD